jgi:sugar lactone lactonase YvrE
MITTFSRPAARQLRSSIVSLAAVSVACATAEKAGKADSAAGAIANVTTATASGKTEGFNTPESVRYDAALDVFFVSNIAGNPSAKDNNGFISKVEAGNTANSTVLVRGGEGGVTLNAPKGMAVQGDTIWVADIDAIRAFDKNTGKHVRSVSIPKATFLNDVVAAPDGWIYFTDTGLRFDSRGNASQAGEDRVLRVKGDKIESILWGSDLSSPNGLAFDKANFRFVVGPWDADSVYTFAPGSLTKTKLAAGRGQFDGIEVLDDGRVLVSSWADSSVSVVRDGKLEKVVSGVDGPADFGFDTKRNVLAIPRFSANTVDYYKISGGGAQ